MIKELKHAYIVALNIKTSEIITNKIARRLCLNTPITLISNNKQALVCTDNII